MIRLYTPHSSTYAVHFMTNNNSSSFQTSFQNTCDSFDIVMSSLSAFEIVFLLDVLVVCAYACPFLLVKFYKYLTKSEIHREIDKINDLLKNTTLEKRSKPNQRLATAFGIDNAFTTFDQGYHDACTRKIEATLERKNNPGSRSQLAQKASIRIQEYVKEYKVTERSMPLVKLIQVLVLNTVVSVFFPKESEINIGHAEKITSLINSLWYNSKNPIKLALAKYSPAHSGIAWGRAELHCLLRYVFQDALRNISRFDPIPPRDNPLNVLLPAYMGLFRVVLRCFLEVRFRRHPKDDQDRKTWKELFQTFIQNPDDDTWYATGEAGISVQMIIAETVRLYPPTRRIYMQQDNKRRVDAVDIETVHRVGDVWGADPQRFDPSRWIKGHGKVLDVSKTKEYIPFGSKGASISRCPSRRRGGPRLIAVLVGVLLHEIDQDWALEPEKETDALWTVYPLRSGRDAYESVMLRNIAKDD
jgi:hypothetical protein